jgi:hypothetical protein
MDMIPPSAAGFAALEAAGYSPKQIETWREMTRLFNRAATDQHAQNRKGRQAANK